MNGCLFDIPPVPPKPENVPEEKCGGCAFIERWSCGGSFFYYCKARKSNRTDNGLLKVKRGNAACTAFSFKGYIE
jgi:hypothetical protein